MPIALPPRTSRCDWPRRSQNSPASSFHLDDGRVEAGWRHSLTPGRAISARVEVAPGFGEQPLEHGAGHRPTRPAECARLDRDGPGEATALGAVGLDYVVLGETSEERQVGLRGVERVPTTLLPDEEVLLQLHDAAEQLRLPGRPDAV